MWLSGNVYQTISDPGRNSYTENVFKTNNDSFKKLPVFACPEVGERCAIHLLDLYLSKLLNKTFEYNVFYVCL